MVKMLSTRILSSMVQAITVLTVLKMLTDAQMTCNQGVGRVVYERLPDQQLQGFDDDVVRESGSPLSILERCADLCLRDRTAANNLVRACSSFDFQPGERLLTSSTTSSSLPATHPTPQYEESLCFLSREQSQPEGIGNLVLSPNSVHFQEICLSSSRVERECPNRRYVFERYPRKKLSLQPADFKEVIVANRSECEDRCLNEFSFVCRSASYDAAAHTCGLSRLTRRSQPSAQLEDHPSADYLENTCLSEERRCDGAIVFVKEESMRLGGPFQLEAFGNVTLEECQARCLRADKYFCRSIEYDDSGKMCALSDEDSASQKDDLRTTSSPTHNLYDLVCLDNTRSTPEFPETSSSGGTSHLFADGRRPETAFTRYRHSRLGGDFHSEITGRSLGECLDECLRQTSFTCRSAVYSDRFRVCRLGRFNTRDGLRMIYDADYDYYENLMSHYIDGEPGLGGGGTIGGQGYRPDPLGLDTSHHGHRPSLNNFGSTSGGSSHFGGGSSNSFYGSGGSSSFGSSGGGAGYPTDNFYGGSAGSSGVGSYGGIPGPGSYGGIPGPGSYGGGSTFGSTHGSHGSTHSHGSGHGVHSAGHGSFGGPGASASAPVGKPSRCEDGDAFRQVGAKLRMRRQFVRRFTTANSLLICEKECAETRDFVCRAFNFRPYSGPFGGERENCELSDRDSRDLDVNNPSYFETTGDYDFYERFGGRAGSDCLDVSQVCSEDGMEFTLRTPEGFMGRIYTHGYYDRCFFRGNGGTVNVLRISGAQGYPDCGTQRFGDSMTNIAVVQFSDYVQTGRDKRYNLTCLFRGPGEAVVTSGYIGAGSGSPIPIEYLPAENTLSSRVRLLILYQGRPTTTIAVGDPLTFRLEAQDGYNYVTDIFASNVIARDPYSGRSVQLIDRYGCPVDNYVFPGLDRSRDGDGLEARFNAFKIPESNFLVFEATVRSCREGCQPAYCTGHAGRNEPSYGRRKRDVQVEPTKNASPSNETEEEEQVREMIEVFESRFDLLQDEGKNEILQESVCLTYGEYYGLIVAFVIILSALVLITVLAGICYRRYWSVKMKNVAADLNSPTEGMYPRDHTSGFSSGNFSNISFLIPALQKTFARSQGQINIMSRAESTGNDDLVSSVEKSREGRVFEDPSEPIYTDPSLFERSRSLRSIAISQVEKQINHRQEND